MPKQAKLREPVQSKAIEILKENRKGLQFIELVDKVKKELTKSYLKISDNTIKSYIQSLSKDRPEYVSKPDWGTFRYQEPEIRKKPFPEARKYKKKENRELYQAFANWLCEEKECTKAVPVGGNRFGDKWTTPDVVGKYELSQRALLKSETVIVSAEVKATVNTQDIITGFGQACAYKVFSHKVYLVTPRNLDENLMRKLESQCSILGIGLVVFDIEKANNPEIGMFNRKVRALATAPDMYWSNEYLREIESDLWPT
jgi:hypothetical protein